MRAYDAADRALPAAAESGQAMTDGTAAPWLALVSALIWATVRLLTSDRLAKRPERACPECGREDEAN